MAERPGRPGRLPVYEIRNRIQQSLELRPQTLYELSRNINCSYDTAKKHANYLISLGIITMSGFSYNGKTIMLYSLRKK